MSENSIAFRNVRNFIALFSQRVLLLTRDGKPSAVIIDPEEFERLTQAARFIAAVTEVLADSNAGRRQAAMLFG